MIFKVCFRTKKILLKVYPIKAPVKLHKSTATDPKLRAQTQRKNTNVYMPSIPNAGSISIEEIENIDRDFEDFTESLQFCI